VQALILVGKKIGAVLFGISQIVTFH